jgi:hypothetical protein
MSESLTVRDNSAMPDADADRDDLDPREAARARRRDREAAAEHRALMQPGMGKVFKQIQDAQAKAAREPAPERKPRKRS